MVTVFDISGTKMIKYNSREEGIKLLLEERDKSMVIRKKQKLEGIMTQFLSILGCEASLDIQPGRASRQCLITNVDVCYDFQYKFKITKPDEGSKTCLGQ